MAQDFQTILEQLSATNVTNTIHQKPYASISPTRPELSQAGKVILVTGGGTGVGFAIARSFVQASASTVIILGRRTDVLLAAASRLEQEARLSGTATKIETYSCDLVDKAQIDAFWKDLSARNINADVLVSSAAKFSEPQPLLKLGSDEIWSQIESNVKGPMYFTEGFCSQQSSKPRYIVNLTSAVIHGLSLEVVAQRPAYLLSKSAGTLYFQILAQEVSSENIQIVSFHPGTIYNDYFKAMGLPSNLFDDDNLPGAFAVWLATKEAEFLHGRLAWASWDIDELAHGDIRKRIEKDPYFLRCSVVGLNTGFLS